MTSMEYQLTLNALRRLYSAIEEYEKVTTNRLFASRLRGLALELERSLINPRKAEVV